METTFISRFTPSLMKHEDLEAIFIQREDLAQRIIENIRHSALTPSKHHTLIIGPRGIGKTHLIALVYHRIKKMEDLNDRLLIAWLREEEWGITSFLDLLLSIFRSLVEEYDDAALTERIESLYALPSDAAEHAALELLKEFVGDRTLLVLMENLKGVFDELGNEGQKRLRAYLQENPFCTILATAQSLFNGVSLQTSPFYGFFNIHHLEELDLDGATNLLMKIADFRKDRELASFIATPNGRARIRAVHHLAGGNYRVYVIFSQFLTRESLDDLVESVMRTLDDLTPYYQARMMWLSPQQRKIVAFLCERRGAVPVKEIAGRCFMTHQTASSQLKLLRDMGYVRSVSIGRESHHELREPLMRLCAEVKKQRGDPIRLLVDFLRLWHSREELEQQLTMLGPDASLEREYILYAIQSIEEGVEDPRVAACWRDYRAFIARGDLSEALKVTEELTAIRGKVSDWLAKGSCLDALQRWDEALESFDKAIEIEPSNVWALDHRGLTLICLGRPNEALESLDKVIEIELNYMPSWLKRGIALDSVGRYDEALKSFDKAIEIEPDNVSAWGIRGATLTSLRRYNEALSSYDKAIKIDPSKALAWSSRGLVLLILERYDEALESSGKAIKLDPNKAEIWSNQGAIMVGLGRLDEALVSYDRAIELGDRSSYVFFNRAVVLLALDRWDEGMAALDNALERFAHADELLIAITEAIVRELIIGRRDAEIWRTRIKLLVDLYSKHQAIADLGQGLVRSIPDLKSPMMSDAAAEAWLEIWQELAGKYDEFQIPLRLLDAAVRYREKQDPRILLRLPVEERKVLEELLGKEE